MATVNTLVVHAAMRTPVTLMAVARAIAPVMVRARPAGVATGGTSTPRYTMRMFSAAAQARRRDTSSSQPTWNPTIGPKASRA